MARGKGRGITMTVNKKSMQVTRRNLKKYGDDKIREIQAITTDSALEIQELAVKKARKDTGALRRSISIKDVKGDKLTWKVFTNMIYAKFIEFRVEPYMFPAYQIGKKSYIKNLKRILKNL